ncbi:MAG: hypothetical protein ACM31C_01570 [Acidobacteriota bacterium]
MRRVWVVLVAACGSKTAPSDGPPAAPHVVEQRPSTSTSTSTSTRAEGAEFLPEAKLVYRVAACAGDAPVPPALKPVVDRHCADILPYLDKYRAKYLVDARAWFVAKEPKDLPAAVVYPFGGGDLISALVPFPDATEITTISLELAGDPRGVGELAPDELDKDLLQFRKQIGLLVANGSNSSINLSNAQRNAVPAQLASHLLGLAAVKADLVSVRYFTIADDGSLHYLERDEIDADRDHARSLRGNWKAPRFARSFANVEVRYRLPGEVTTRVHRHIAWNLDDRHLREQPQLLAHLAHKGKVSVLVKGASYLLWLADFSVMRGYLLDHLAWMVSDSTGIPPNLARGMKQDTFGAFHGPIIDKVEDRPEDDATRELWKHNKAQALPFRFGYLDKDGDPHVMITHPR